MKINRNNYEELFLLYVDGELTALQMQTVDRFAAENPDLLTELKMLMQTKLEVEPILFDTKHLLLKSNDKELSQQNYEEHFLLYVDDELKQDEKSEVETFVLQHPQLQASFTLLKQTKLEPEHIVFDDKSSLYKRENKPVVYLSFTRIAIAAAIIGSIFLVWTIIPSKQNNETGIASIKQQSVIPLENNNSSVSGQPSSNQLLNISKERVKSKQGINISKESNNASAFVTESTVMKNNELETRTLNALKQETIMAQENLLSAPEINSKQIVNSTASINETENKNIIEQTVYKELDTREEERNNKVYIGNMEVNKDKLLGLLKRAKTVFAKSKDDDNNVSIASFSISTKSK